MQVASGRCRLRAFFDICVHLRSSLPTPHPAGDWIRKGQREEAGPTAAEVRMHEAAVKEQRQTRQYRINKWIDLYNKSDGTQKEHLYHMMRNDWDSFDPETQKALGYHLKLSPLGETERKKRLFLDQKGPVPENKFDPETQQQNWAEMEFYRMDKKWQYESYMGLTPPKVPGTVQVAKDLYGKREEGGIVRLISTESERWDEISKGHDTTKEALALADFQVDVGTRRTVKNGPMIYETVQKRDLLTGKTYVDIVPVMKDVGVKAAELPKDVLEFTSYYHQDKGDDSTAMGRLFGRYKQLLEVKHGEIKPNQALQMTIGAAFPNLNFKAVNTAEYGKGDWFFHNYHKGEKEFMVAFPGKLTAFPALGDTVKYYYYDQATDMVYSGNGKQKGTYEEIVVDSMKSMGEANAR